MPNTTVPATGGAMPTAKFNRSRIMKAAWEHYRFVRTRYADWQIARGIVDASFANALRIAWRQAKEEAAKAEQEHRLAAGPNAGRAGAIQAQIEALQYKSLRYDTDVMRRRLDAELAALAA